MKNDEKHIMKKVLCVFGSAGYSCGISLSICLFVRWFSNVDISYSWHLFLSIVLIVAFVFLGLLLYYPLAKMAEVARGCAVVSIFPCFFCMWYSVIYPWFFHSITLFEGEIVAVSILVDIAVVLFFIIIWVGAADKAKVMLGYVDNPVCSTEFVKIFNFIVFMGVVLGGFYICFKEHKGLPPALFSVVGFIVLLTPFITTQMQKRLKLEMKEGYVFSFKEESDRDRESKQKYIDEYSGMCRLFIGLFIISIAVGIYASVEYCSDLVQFLKKGWYWYNGQPKCDCPDVFFTIVAWIVPLYFIFNIISVPLKLGRLNITK